MVSTTDDLDARTRAATLRREDACTVDEVAVVADLVGDGDGVLVDVGAHHGSATQRFASRGWTVHAFEPDAENRERLLRRVADRPGVVVDPRAVSDVDDAELAFFRSDVSTGISGLHAFHDSHRRAGSVRTVRLDSYLAANGVESLDVLKVDAEGHDLAVLRGLGAWDVRPSAVVCEFEDARTLPMGHTWEAMAGLLDARGYDVWVSIWHPVVAYGRRHDWRGHLRYPCVVDRRCWGNLLALPAGTDADAVQAAFTRRRVTHDA